MEEAQFAGGNRMSVELVRIGIEDAETLWKIIAIYMKKWDITKQEKQL